MCSASVVEANAEALRSDNTRLQEVIASLQQDAQRLELEKGEAQSKADENLEAFRAKSEAHGDALSKLRETSDKVVAHEKSLLVP